MVGEARLIFCVPAAAGVIHGLLRGAEICGVDVAVGVKRLEKAHDGLAAARRGLYFEAAPAGEILPKVEHGFAARRGHQARREGVCDPDSLAARGREHGDILRDGLDRRPRGIVEAGLVPARLLQPRVVGLAVVYLGEQDRTARAFPACVAADNDPAPASVVQNYAAAEGGARAVVVAVEVVAHLSLVPARAERHAEGVGAGKQLAAYVVYLIKQVFVVGRPAGGEDIAADFSAVHIRDVQAVRRADKVRGLRQRVDIKLLAEQCPEAFVLVGLLLGSYEFTRPLGVIHIGGDEAAVAGGLFSGVVGDFRTDVVSLYAFQPGLRADVRRFVGDYLAGIEHALVEGGGFADAYSI